jgi:glycerophosphoryl diester phosphodiesterase
MLEPLIIGHRGASAGAPENTLIAFERAMADGADGVEFDVQLARDGVPVVIHDATLKRTGLRAGAIVDLLSTELEKTDVGTWFNLRYPARAHSEFANATVPTLARVLEYFKIGEAMLYIEMKCALRDSRALAHQVVHLIHEYQLSTRVVVESFKLDAILETKKIDRDVRTAALFEPKLSRLVPSKRAMIEEALACEADEIALHRSLATPRTVEEARRRGLHVVVWTADHPSWIGRALKYGIHAIITNVPGRMCEQRRELSSAQTHQGSDALHL